MATALANQWHVTMADLKGKVDRCIVSSDSRSSARVYMNLFRTISLNWRKQAISLKCRLARAVAASAKGTPRGGPALLTLS